MNLFDLSNIDIVDVDESIDELPQETIINPKQMSLFSPVDMALLHQLAPAV